MAFRDATQAEVFQAVLAFYRQRFNLPPECVYPSIEPLNPPLVPPGGDFWISVAIAEGEFPHEEQDDEQLFESSALTVMGFTRMQLDQANKETAFLFDPQRGALAIKAKLLLIVGHQLEIADGANPEGAGITASRVFARRSIKPSYDDQNGVGWVGIVVGVDFDWHVAGAEDLGDG